MNRKTILNATFLFLLLSAQVFTLNTKVVRGAEIFYITVDGAIEPPTASIATSDNVTYYLTDNINTTLVIERNNIRIDGANYTIQADYYSDVGIDLTERENITITNAKVKGFTFGIYLWNATNIRIYQNDISNCYRGIRVYYGSNNSIFDNYLSDSTIENIELDNSPYNIVDGNSISNVPFSSTSESYGIKFDHCPNTTISKNQITNQKYAIRATTSFCNLSDNIVVQNNYGISFSESNNNTFSRNIITDNAHHGLYLISCANNTVFENDIANNGIGIWLEGSSDDIVYNNNFVDNEQQVWLQSSTCYWDNNYPAGGNFWSDYSDVDVFSGPFQNETGVDGIWDNPYLISETIQDNYPFKEPLPNNPWFPMSFFEYSPSAPIVSEPVIFNASKSYDIDGFIVNYEWNFGDGMTSTETTPTTTHSYEISGSFYVTLTITDNDGKTKSTVKNVTVEKIPTVVSISASCPSTFIGFQANISGTLQDVYGNSLPDKTVILHYTFSGLEEWIPITSGTTDSLGNYMATWTPPATGYFIIKVAWEGDSIYLESDSNTTLSSLSHDNQYVFSVESNSTITALAFNTNNWKLSFAVTGPNGTNGYVKVTVAKSLVDDIANIRVFMDGRENNFTITSLDGSWLLFFIYEHSTHDVDVDLDVTIIPDFSPLIMLLTLIIVTSTTVIFRKKLYPPKNTPPQKTTPNT